MKKFSITQLPKSMAVIGRGPIGCELGKLFGVQLRLLLVKTPPTQRRSRRSSGSPQTVWTEGIRVLPKLKLSELKSLMAKVPLGRRKLRWWNFSRSWAATQCRIPSIWCSWGGNGQTGIEVNSKPRQRILASMPVDVDWWLSVHPCRGLPSKYSP